jgi:hypothetical protein
MVLTPGEFFFFLVGLEFEFRALSLQSRYSTTCTTPSAHFIMVILETVVTQTICPGWPQAFILPIAASQVARIIDMSLQCLIYARFLRETGLNCLLGEGGLEVEERGDA